MKHEIWGISRNAHKLTFSPFDYNLPVYQLGFIFEPLPLIQWMLFGALNSCSIVFEGSLVIISLFNNWWIFFVTSFRRDNLVWNDNFSFLSKPHSSLFRKNEVCAWMKYSSKTFQILLYFPFKCSALCVDKNQGKKK